MLYLETERYNKPFQPGPGRMKGSDFIRFFFSRGFLTPAVFSSCFYFPETHLGEHRLLWITDNSLVALRSSHFEGKARF